VYLTFQVSSYCDSYKFTTAIDSIFQNVEYLNFISDVIKYRVSKSTYTKRTDLIMPYMNPDIQVLEYGKCLVKCDATIRDIPTANEVTECISCPSEKSERSIMYLTHQVDNEGRLDDLQHFLDERIETDFINCTQCDNMKSVKTIISKLNLVIDVLYWEGK